MYSREGTIIGKYKVEYPCPVKNLTNVIYTDNALEAMWEANRKNGTIINLCGEKQFYRDENRWRILGV